MSILSEMTSEESISEVLKSMAEGRALDPEKVFNIVSMVCCRTHENCEIQSVLDEEKYFDEYTYRHSINVAFYSMLLGKWMNLNKSSIFTAVKAGLLHDIGKTMIPVQVLNKKEKLSDEDMVLIRKHPLYSYIMIGKMKCFSDEVAEAVLMHHERVDRSGYPFGIDASQTSVYTKIIAITDVYDAMTSDRVYHKKYQAMEVIRMLNSTGKDRFFDPGIVNVFTANMVSILESDAL